MKLSTMPQLSRLKDLRGNPAIAYMAPFTGDGVPLLYESLRMLGRIDHLDLVLVTTGGSITRARQMAILLREYANGLTILVPSRARSAGTLLCLAADELLLGPMAELGPIDSHIDPVRPAPSDAPGSISAADVRAFSQMAEEWFGVTREEDRLQVLALVAQRVFPTSLSSFYRSDKLIRQIACELLEYQLPEADGSSRQRIVDRLVGGYHAHDYILSRAEVRELGLKTRDMSPQEEALLWDMSQTDRVTASGRPGRREDEEKIGVSWTLRT